MIAYAKWGSPVQGFFDINTAISQSLYNEYKRLGFLKFMGAAVNAPSEQFVEFLDRFTHNPGEKLKDLATLKSYPALAEAWKRAYGTPTYENIKALDVANAAYMLEAIGAALVLYPAAKGISAGVRCSQQNNGTC